MSHALNRRKLGLVSRINCKYFASLTNVPNAGDKIHDFTCERTLQVPELQLTATALRHDNTGAKHLHITRDDPNNVFSIGFKTLAPDDTGVPHILEHTTLCGSRKFNVRDPFFKMLNRSLSNFMNAMTATHYTYYPFASTNAADIANLREVYLDATLFPLLKENDFRQEGWRLEHENPKDNSSPIIFKGVVYNEMKGMMSDASYVFYSKFQKEIYSSLNDSGGDPSVIPQLTYQQLKEFHKRNYHPSNCRIFSYGDLPLESHLKHLNETFKPFSRQLMDDRRYTLPQLAEKKVIETTGPHDPLSDQEKQVKVSFSYIMNDTVDPFENFSLRILSDLLMDGHSSPLYQSLIDARLGNDWSPNTGYDSSNPTALFTVGLQGVAEKDIELIEETIQSVFERAYSHGFEAERLHGILQQLEVRIKHQTANFGMSLLSSISPGWFNGTDPFAMLAWNDTVTKFRRLTEKGDYLRNLLQKYFLGKSYAKFIMRPSAEFTSKSNNAEKKRLNRAVGELDDQSRLKLQKQAAELVKSQEVKENLSCLPTLHTSDIPRKGSYHNVEVANLLEGIPVHKITGNTNGITYIRMKSVLNDFPPHLRAYLPLFCDALLNLGTKTEDMAALETQIKAKTGGISFRYQTSASPFAIGKFEESIVASGYALDQYAPSMFELFKKLIFDTNFDNVEKLRSLIDGQASGGVDAMANSGHVYARSFASSKLTSLGRVVDETNGLHQVQFLSALAKQEALDDTISKLKQITNLVFFKNTLSTAVTCQGSSFKLSEPKLLQFVESLPLLSQQQSTLPISPEYMAKVFIPLPFQVSYVSKCVLGAPYTHADGPALQLLSSLLTQKYLHGELREKGGAYGGGATYGGTSGIFGFYSYRDPNPLKSIETMNNAGRWALENKWEAKDLDEAKLSVFQKIDAPKSISDEGMVQVLDNISPEMRQTRRERILDTSIPDILRAAEKYLVHQRPENSAIAVLGDKSSLVDQGDWNIYDWDSM